MVYNKEDRHKMPIEKFWELTSFKKENENNVFLPYKPLAKCVYPTLGENLNYLNVFDSSLNSMKNRILSKYDDGEFMHTAWYYHKLGWDFMKFLYLEDIDYYFPGLFSFSYPIYTLAQNVTYMVFDMGDADFKIKDIKNILSPILEHMFTSDNSLYAFIYLSRLGEKFLAIDINHLTMFMCPKIFTEMILPYKPIIVTVKAPDFNFWLYQFLMHIYDSTAFFKSSSTFMLFPTRNFLNYPKFQPRAFMWQDWRSMYLRLSANLIKNTKRKLEAEYKALNTSSDFNEMMGTSFNSYEFPKDWLCLDNYDIWGDRDAAIKRYKDLPEAWEEKPRK